MVVPPASRNEVHYVQEYRARIYQERKVNRLDDASAGGSTLPFVSARETEEMERMARPTLQWHVPKPQNAGFKTDESVTNLFSNSEWQLTADRLRRQHSERLKQLKSQLRDERRSCKRLEARLEARLLAQSSQRPARGSPLHSSKSCPRLPPLAPRREADARA